jgi:hypothetical protein
VARRTAEILAGACCSTWFVQTQHHTPVATLSRSEGPVRERLLGPLSRGELLSGVAYAHLRSYPRTPVRVTRRRDGWRFDGTVPWYTGWGLNDVMLLAGVTDGGEVLFAFTEAREQPGLRASEPMRLAALTASRTVSLELDGLWLPEEAVALRKPYEEWAATDRAKTVDASPAVFGITEAALAPLGEETAEPLRSRLEEIRGRAYELADLPMTSERMAERLTLRIRAAELMRTATTAGVVAGGGRSMSLTGTAQRLAREALFLLVQGQTAQSRGPIGTYWARSVLVVRRDHDEEGVRLQVHHDGRRLALGATLGRVLLGRPRSARSSRRKPLQHLRAHSGRHLQNRTSTRPSTTCLLHFACPPSARSCSRLCVWSRTVSLPTSTHKEKISAEWAKAALTAHRTSSGQACESKETSHGQRLAHQR